ncbi:hypothetical protein ACLOJK_029789 [Asimina triloba]
MNSEREQPDPLKPSFLLLLTLSLLEQAFFLLPNAEAESLSSFSRHLPSPPSLNLPGYHLRPSSQLTRRSCVLPFPTGPRHGRLLSARASASLSQPLTDAISASPYLSVRIRCRKDVALTTAMLEYHWQDMLSEALLCFGASSVSVDEVGNCHGAEEIYINSIFTEGQDVRASISYAADSIGLDKRPSYEVANGEQCDWVKNSLGLIKGGECFLDYGTGSGILAIAAIKLGAAVSVGIDIDPQAITSARQNAALNKIQPDQMPLYLASESISSTPNGSVHGQESNCHTSKSVIRVEKFDIVMANILLNPLLELADQIVAYAKPGAAVGLSGILSEQISEVEKCYSQHLDDILVAEMDGWACVSGIKKL